MQVRVPIVGAAPLNEFFEMVGRQWFAEKWAKNRSSHELEVRRWLHSMLAAGTIQPVVEISVLPQNHPDHPDDAGEPPKRQYFVNPIFWARTTAEENITRPSVHIPSDLLFARVQVPDEPGHFSDLNDPTLVSKTLRQMDYGQDFVTDVVILVPNPRKSLEGLFGGLWPVEDPAWATRYGQYRILLNYEIIAVGWRFIAVFGADALLSRRNPHATLVHSMEGRAASLLSRRITPPAGAPC